MNRTVTWALVWSLAAVLAMGCASKPTDEEMRQLEALKAEVVSLEKQISGLESEKASLQKMIADKDAQIAQCEKDKALVQQRLRGM